MQLRSTHTCGPRLLAPRGSDLVIMTPAKLSRTQTDHCGLCATAYHQRSDPVWGLLPSTDWGGPAHCADLRPASRQGRASPLGVGGPAGHGLEETHALEAAVQQVDEPHAERREQVEGLTDEVASWTGETMATHQRAPPQGWERHLPEKGTNTRPSTGQSASEGAQRGHCSFPNPSASPT